MRRVITQMNDRFSKSSFLSSFIVLNPNYFNTFKEKFPNNHVVTIAEHYPFLSKETLATELSVIYQNETFNHPNATSTIDLFRIITDLDLQSTFEQVNLLLQIILTTPISSFEPERCFSTLKRIKTFLRNSMGQDRLNALAVLTIHADIISKDNDFHTKVIDKFASMKERRLDFTYK